MPKLLQFKVKVIGHVDTQDGKGQAVKHFSCRHICNHPCAHIQTIGDCNNTILALRNIVLQKTKVSKQRCQFGGGACLGGGGFQIHNNKAILPPRISKNQEL